jgi:hypothetical protein
MGDRKQGCERHRDESAEIEQNIIHVPHSAGLSRLGLVRGNTHAYAFAAAPARLQAKDGATRIGASATSLDLHSASYHFQ